LKNSCHNNLPKKTSFGVLQVLQTEDSCTLCILRRFNYFNSVPEILLTLNEMVRNDPEWGDCGLFQGIKPAFARRRDQTV